MVSDPVASAAGDGSAGPVLGLLARGLELWLRRACEGIEALEIQLQGSAAQLMVGRLEGVSLEARRVVYRDLRLDRVSLRSGPIRVRMASLLPGRTLDLGESFQVSGRVAFRDDDLGRSLASPAWHQLGDELALALLGMTPLAGLRIEEQRLVLRALPSGSSQPVDVATLVRAVAGSLELEAEGGGAVCRLPMDPAIQIRSVTLQPGVLELEGDARVSA